MRCKSCKTMPAGPFLPAETRAVAMNKIPDKPVETASGGPVDIEAIAQNFARLVEQGGKALAAYMRPREQNEPQSGFSDEVADVVKTLSQVAEYWLSDPARAVELQANLGHAYLDLWGAAAKRM